MGEGCGRRGIGKGKARLVVKVARMPGSVQDFYLAEIRRRMVPVTVFLVNGSELRGVVKAFDPFTITLEYENKTHLVYKHAISTISPQGPITIAAPAAQAEP
jgi:host factor-I protein